VTAFALLAAVVLLVANGFFVATEFALVAARRTRLEQLVEEGSRRAPAALAASRRLSLMLAGAQLGITMASLGLGYVAEPAVASLIESAIDGAGLPSGVEHAVALVIALIIVVFFHMVIGEMAPKNLAIVDPEGLSMVLARPMLVFVRVLGPLIHMLNATANAIVRLVGVEPADELLSAATAEDLAAMLATSRRAGVVDEQDARLLTGALGFRGRRVAEVMVPRETIVALPADASPAQVQTLVEASGHSRILVYDDDVDGVVGFIHVKSLLEVPPLAWNLPLPSRLVTRMLVVAEEQPIHDVLVAMQRAGVHLAVVLDVAGLTRGLVSMEDVIEALVGDIGDEYDRHPSPGPHRSE